jgi:hypothetical protein
MRGPIGFREECPECAAFLHTCPNCRNYEPHRRDCRILTTEPVHDRESANFCEDYEFGVPGTGTATTSSSSAAAPPSRPPATNGRGGRSSGSPASGGKISSDEARRRFENLFRDPKA